jgi:L-ascorbate metabolism protein UlaG (beta-lactamase superfamily)
VRLALVRSATLLLETSRGRVLVDPMLRAAGTTPPIENTLNPQRNPLVELPFAAERVVEGIDACIEWAMTRARHGTGAIGEAMGPVSGWVIDGVYLAGDTIWCDEVLDSLERRRPRAVVVNGSGARFDEGGPIVMDAADVQRVREATDATVVVVHLEALNHCVERRPVYRAIDGVIVPDDGETLDV